LLPKKIAIAVLAFVIFRIVDIVKPWPAGFFDKRRGGWSIMLDDVVAGVYTNLLLQIGIYFFR
ncbi:MAG: phosphatidylglycerophosphatase A, partial [Bacteroidota bacterium]|nr:phosphatidylglycerophosphatase A [Bacteroidota bacterium]